MDYSIILDNPALYPGKEESQSSYEEFFEFSVYGANISGIINIIPQKSRTGLPHTTKLTKIEEETEVIVYDPFGDPYTLVGEPASSREVIVYDPFGDPYTLVGEPASSRKERIAISRKIRSLGGPPVSLSVSEFREYAEVYPFGEPGITEKNYDIGLLLFGNDTALISILVIAELGEAKIGDLVRETDLTAEKFNDVLLSLKRYGLIMASDEGSYKMTNYGVSVVNILKKRR